MFNKMTRPAIVVFDGTEELHNGPVRGCGPGRLRSGSLWNVHAGDPDCSARQ